MGTTQKKAKKKTWKTLVDFETVLKRRAAENGVATQKRLDEKMVQRQEELQKLVGELLGVDLRSIANVEYCVWPKTCFRPSMCAIRFGDCSFTHGWRSDSLWGFQWLGKGAIKVYFRCVGCGEMVPCGEAHDAAAVCKARVYFVTNCKNRCRDCSIRAQGCAGCGKPIDPNGPLTSDPNTGEYWHTPCANRHDLLRAPAEAAKSFWRKLTTWDWG
jgi:hypothetical protein